MIRQSAHGPEIPTGSCSDYNDRLLYSTALRLIDFGKYKRGYGNQGKENRWSLHPGLPAKAMVLSFSFSEQARKHTLQHP
jgi:hypothetical protein